MIHLSAGKQEHQGGIHSRNKPPITAIARLDAHNKTPAIAIHSTCSPVSPAITHGAASKPAPHARRQWRTDRSNRNSPSLRDQASPPQCQWPSSLSNTLATSSRLRFLRACGGLRNADRQRTVRAHTHLTAAIAVPRQPTHAQRTILAPASPAAAPTPRCHLGRAGRPPATRARKNLPHPPGGHRQTRHFLGYRQ